MGSLDLDLDLDSEEESASGAVKKNPMKLSAILPKPSPKSNKSTPASSSKKGVISKQTPKLTEKRKRLEEATAAAAAANTKAKKLKLDSEEETQDTDQEAKASGPDFIKGTSQSGRIRKVRRYLTCSHQNLLLFYCTTYVIISCLSGFLSHLFRSIRVLIIIILQCKL